MPALTGASLLLSGARRPTAVSGGHATSTIRACAAAGGELVVLGVEQQVAAGAEREQRVQRGHGAGEHLGHGDHDQRHGDEDADQGAARDDRDGVPDQGRTRPRRPGTGPARESAPPVTASGIPALDGGVHEDGADARDQDRDTSSRYAPTATVFAVTSTPPARHREHRLPELLCPELLPRQHRREARAGTAPIWSDEATRRSRIAWCAGCGWPTNSSMIPSGVMFATASAFSRRFATATSRCRARMAPVTDPHAAQGQDLGQFRAGGCRAWRSPPRSGLVAGEGEEAALQRRVPGGDLGERARGRRSGRGR